MNPYLRAVRWAGTKRWFAPIGRHVLTPIDQRMQGRSVSISTFATGLPLGYLTTVGRRTGQLRTTPLLYVVPPNAVAAVVGTNFGGRNRPSWVANLEAQPRATWQVVDPAIEVTARPADPAEHRALWPQFVAMWPGYDGYVARSQRHPRMFLLEHR